jgi:integrase/recombinase XerD
MMELLELCLLHGDVCAWALIFFAAKTGLRKGELLGMTLHDLNTEGHFDITTMNNNELLEFTKLQMKVQEYGFFMTPPKAKRSNRIGFMDDETVHVMQQYLEWRNPRAMSTDALWITPGGYPLDKNGPYNLVTKYASMLGIHDPMGPLNKKFTPHCCRHFFTTHMRRSGMSREFIQELRGDSRGEAIDIYDHIDPEELKRSYLQHVPKLLRIDTKQSTLIPFQ